VVAIGFTSAARALFRAMAVAQPVAWVEVDAKFGVVSAAGLTGEPLIAVLNSHIDVYLLEPPPPAPAILAIHDTRQPARLLVVDFPSAPASSHTAKTFLAGKAAASAGIIVHDMHIVP
jgi:hypothetical protein